MPPPAARFGLSWNPEPVKKGNSTIKGIRVVKVNFNSPAARAGLRRGDLITEFAGVPVQSSMHFQQLVMMAANPVALTVQRPRQKKPLKLTAKLNGQGRRVGITWSVDEAEPGTVVLRRVLEGSPAYIAGLRAGDRIYAIGGKRFRSSSEFRDKMAQATDGLKITMERRGHVRVVKLRVFSPPNGKSVKGPAAKTR